MKESKGQTSQVIPSHKGCFLPHSEGKSRQTSCKYTYFTLYNLKEAAGYMKENKKLVECRIYLCICFFSF